MKNKQDVQKELQSIESRIDELRIRRVMASKLGFMHDLSIMNKENELLYEMKSNLTGFLEILKKQDK